MSEFLQQMWYRGHPLAYLLLPVSWVFCLLVMLRRMLYKLGIMPIRRVPVPIIVVGNITAGGTGKTPLTIWIAKMLTKAGYTPGIVSRGYGGDAEEWPQQVSHDSDPYYVGDEPVLLVRRTGCPMAVGPNRNEAIEMLLEHHPCDVIISDDGLQHYRMGRDFEIGVIDGDRRFGNGFCLPAGPLREPTSRLNSVDVIVSTGSGSRREFILELIPGELRKVGDDSVTAPVSQFTNQTVHAVAGIGNPQRFFETMSKQGFHILEHAFPDHHDFIEEDFDKLKEDGDYPIIMTEKDAVKCWDLEYDNMWYLPITPKMDPNFGFRILKALKSWYARRRIDSNM